MNRKQTLNRKITRSFPKLIFGIVSLFFTILVCANSYELIANKDIPFGFSLAAPKIQYPINRTIVEFANKPNSQFLNSNAKLGILDTLVFSNLSIRIQLEEARRIDSVWYERPSFGEYIELNRDKFNNAIDYLIYMTASWRTLPEPETIDVGSEVTLTTKSGLAETFQVASRDKISNNSPMIVAKSERRQVILMIEDPYSSSYYGYSLIAL